MCTNNWSRNWLLFTVSIISKNIKKLKKKIDTFEKINYNKRVVRNTAPAGGQRHRYKSYRKYTQNRGEIRYENNSI